MTSGSSSALPEIGRGDVRKSSKADDVSVYLVLFLTIRSQSVWLFLLLLLLLLLRYEFLRII